MYKNLNKLRLIRNKSHELFQKLLCDGFYGEKTKMSMAYRSICMFAILSMHFRKESHFCKNK